MNAVPPHPRSVIDALQKAWDRSDWLFARVPQDRWLSRGIELRHPFLFYVGHLPAFSWNHVSASLGLGPFDEALDLLFARGIDPADEAEAEGLRPTSWPTVDATLAYRDGVRRALLDQVDAIEAKAPTDPVARNVLSLVLEHELMHHETLLYMIRQLDPATLVSDPEVLGAELGEPPVERKRLAIAAGPVRMGAELGEIGFGWDNEFPSEEVEVPAFAIDQVPVTVGDFRRFVEAGGYTDSQWWAEGDFAWQQSTGRTAPLGWRLQSDAWEVRSMWAWYPIDQAQAWPVYVSYAEAQAFAQWSRSRLPTEAEMHRAAFTTPEGKTRPYPWGFDEPAPRHGGFGFHRQGRLPVGSRPDGASAWGVKELVGNGWEWTSTPFLPRLGFAAIHPNYPGYSADFFDGDHYVVFGASWATDERLIRRSFRNWYQGRYPYVFATFRTCAR